MDKIVVCILGVLGFIVVVVAVSALSAIPVMLLYNYVVPTQFGLKEIDFLHAWAFLILSSLIFKSPTLQNKKD